MASFARLIKRLNSLPADRSGGVSRFGLMRQCLRSFFSGWVQGVGFRYTVKTLAQGFEVTGMVRNLSDGRVELVAEGEKEELEMFLQAIASSEVGHFIKRTESSWSEPGHRFSGFEIAR